MESAWASSASRHGSTFCSRPVANVDVAPDRKPVEVERIVFLRSGIGEFVTHWEQHESRVTRNVDELHLCIIPSHAPLPSTRKLGGDKSGAQRTDPAFLTVFWSFVRSTVAKPSTVCAPTTPDSWVSGVGNLSGLPWHATTIVRASPDRTFASWLQTQCQQVGARAFMPRVRTSHTNPSGRISTLGQYARPPDQGKTRSGVKNRVRATCSRHG